MTEGRLALTLACLLVIVGGVMWLEWLHAGELELLESRVDELEHWKRNLRTTGASSTAKRKRATKGGNGGTD